METKNTTGNISRFDYVKYDDQATELQAAFKGNLQSIEGFIEVSLKSPRAKALALTKLEECYMWIGKAIRDDQIARGGSSLDIPERTTN